MKDTPKIDPALIPEYTWDVIAMGVLDLLDNIRSQPDGREKLEKKRAENMGESA